MTRYLLLLCGLLPALTALPQTDYSPYLTTLTVEGKNVPVLRVPPEKVHTSLVYQDAVRGAQQDLDRDQKLLREGKGDADRLEYRLEKYLVFLDKLTSFPAQYYRQEAKAYEEWGVLLEKRKREAREVRAKRFEDSVRIERLKEGYAWISPDSVWIKQKPDAKATTIGRLYRLSYVQAYEVEGKPDWAEIQFGDHTGYVMLNQLAGKWEDMQLSDEELGELKKGRYYNFIPAAAYKAKLAKEAAAYEQANTPPKRNYIVGPRGGCYYIDSNGNKKYVDHSFCN